MIAQVKKSKSQTLIKFKAKDFLKGNKEQLAKLKKVKELLLDPSCPMDGKINRKAKYFVSLKETSSKS